MLFPAHQLHHAPSPSNVNGAAILNAMRAMNVKRYLD